MDLTKFPPSRTKLNIRWIYGYEGKSIALKVAAQTKRCKKVKKESITIKRRYL